MAKTTGKRVMRPARRPFGALDAVAVFLLCALALLLLFTALVPAALGLTPYAVSSDSMEPTLRRGDLVYVKPVSFSELEVGDIVTVETVRGAVFTHRIYELDQETRTVRTKGDAASRPDSGPFNPEEIAGRVVYRIPLLGHISLWAGGGRGDTP